MNMTRIRQICLRLSKLKKTDYIVILLVGLLLLIVVLPVKEDKKTCSNSQKKAKAKSVSESTCDDEEYEKLLEKKLEGILERMARCAFLPSSDTRNIQYPLVVWKKSPFGITKACSGLPNSNSTR